MFFASINDKIVETLSSNGVTSENETIHTPPPSFNSIQSWDEYGSQVTYRYMLFEQQLSLAWREWGRESLIFSFLILHNIRKAFN